MLLQNKTAILFGGGGSLGKAIANTLADAGAKVFISNHTIEPVNKIVTEILSRGGKAEGYAIDALDEKAVNDFTAKVLDSAGHIDVAINLINTKDIQGIPLVDMSLEDYSRPGKRVLDSHFITGTAVGRVMMKQGSGVILSLTATPGGIGYPHAGGFGVACHIIENFSLGLASELGPYGVRVVNIRSAGSPDSQVFKDAIEHGGSKAKEFIKKIEDDTMLKKMPLMQDIANTALFLASEMAAGITGVSVDVTCGTTTALNYKITPIAFIRKD